MTYIRQFFGNLFYKRRKVLTSVHSSLAKRLPSKKQVKPINHPQDFGKANHQASSYVTSLTNQEKQMKVVDLKKPIKNEEKNPNYLIIKKFVTNYLNPYIRGYITRDNEPSNKPAMMELLIKEMGVIDVNEKDKIEKLALDIYIQLAAKGFHETVTTEKAIRICEYNEKVKGIYIKPRIGFIGMNSGWLEYKEDYIDPNSDEINPLVEALKEALPKDFPSQKISEKDLKDMAICALSNVNEEIKALLVLLGEKNEN